MLELTRDAFGAASDLLAVTVDASDLSDDFAEHEEELWLSRGAMGELNMGLGRFLELARLALDDAGSY
ncbi:hypothetical protein ACFQ0X_03120 [Streptomyces rectiviolaceus]|uniref:Uncharacterized protein n=1 Tax=Streptomyces rectiviolaceus TaxID=332591 RepID=A0ABP6MDT9_9ACTN